MQDDDDDDDGVYFLSSVPRGRPYPSQVDTFVQHAAGFYAAGVEQTTTGAKFQDILKNVISLGAS